MNKLLLSALVVFTFGLFTSAQTTLFQDDFESGTSNWNFNGSGDNAWTVNNIYAGFLTLIPDTPNQPGGNTNYMHIVNGTVCSSLGVCNANFDTGSASLQNADLATGVDASGATSVSLEYWYLCAGSSGTSYGSVYVSADGGATWTNVATYSGVSNWTQETLDITALAAGQSNVLVRFQWQNGGAGNDPAFSVDDVVIAAMMGGGGSNAISTTNDVTPATWCEGTTESVTVNFTATGTYTAGNLFTAELSDASGSFASPTAIGSLSSSASGAQSINCTVPGSMPAGTGYRIRVLSTTPSVTGTDNGTDLVISTPPTVTLAAFTTVCVYDPVFALTGGSPAGGTYSGPGVVAGAFSPSSAGVGTHSILYTYTDGNGCSGTTQQALVVDACADINEEKKSAVAVYPNPTNGLLTVKGDIDYDQIIVLDLSGRKVFERNRTASDSYDLNEIPTGVYLVKVSGPEGVHSFRVIKR